MRTELLAKRDDLLIRRLVLGPDETTPWHTDTCHRFSVVVRGDELTIEFAEEQEREVVPVHAGLASWDAPTSRTHRAVNTGGSVYEEVVVFFLDPPGIEPQPGWGP